VNYPWLKAVDAEFSDRRASGRIPHAILFSGPADIGKLSLALEFLAGLLCLEDTHPACGVCRSCQLLATGAHPDRHIVTFEEHPKTGDLRKEIVIGQVRKLISSLYLTNTISRRKAALIYPVEAMNHHTANALLKTLEEPPGDTVLILLSHDPARLPATIRSRCQNLRARLPETDQAVKWLCESAPAGRQEAAAALAAAAGSPLRALRMLEDGSTDQFRLVTRVLDDLRAGSSDPLRAMAELAEVDPVQLWSWLSLHAADRVRGFAGKGAGNGGGGKDLSLLQSAADRNRRLLPTAVRKDLLLQDWLIQWSRLRS